MTTPGDPGQQPWEKQPPSGAFEPPPIEQGYGAQPGSAPPPSGYPPPQGYGQPPGYGQGYGQPPSGYGPPPSTPPSYPPPGGYGAPPPYQPGYPTPPQSRTNGMAIGSLVSSVLAIPLAFLCGIFGVIAALVGVVLGIVAINQIKQSGEDGRGLAIAGIAVGGVTLALAVIVMIVGIGWYAANM
ncbi:MAG: DUF4190 domain-containing protein [Candidatus Sericytochromatia bacterium]